MISSSRFHPLIPATLASVHSWIPANAGSPQLGYCYTTTSPSLVRFFVFQHFQLGSHPLPAPPATHFLVHKYYILLPEGQWTHSLPGVEHGSIIAQKFGPPPLVFPKWKAPAAQRALIHSFLLSCHSLVLLMSDALQSLFNIASPTIRYDTTIVTHDFRPTPARFPPLMTLRPLRQERSLDWFMNSWDLMLSLS
ncbi:hypothetical protein MSAN_01743100 [Mycena sanguinolenta]|uniref:Uncharacterized protein n=1 Tax=Mycena sanguinolenta TaxID=230812 RepID=A0A8H7CVA0_9AGAR|nr:hypothetical protein MSAN_01743100 [Mycena sanguinolenta]